MTEDRDPRRDALWALQDFSRGRGLEIGPLHAPIVGRDEADVRYVDVRDQAGLREYYAADPRVPVDDISSVDYHLQQADGRSLTLAEACRDGAPFAWAVASHVIEHVPDLIEWLADLAELVEDDGALVLAVPDRRYCFDVHRPPTTVGQMLEAHELRATRPSTRAVYDYVSAIVDTDVRDLWDGAPPDYSQRMHTIDEALQKVADARAGAYVDCHVWLFTPNSFLEQMHELRTIGASSWIVDSIQPTPEYQIEFMVRLRRIPRHLDPTAAHPSEVVTGRDRPDWLDQQLAGRRSVAALEAELEDVRDHLRRLRRRLERRSAKVRELRGEVRAQQARIVRLRRSERQAVEAVQAMRRSWRWRVGSAVVGVVPRRAGRRGGAT